MPNVERQRMLNTLNKQKQRLMKKGASPDDIRAYFGVDLSVPFSKLSPTQLKATRDRVKAQPKVTVRNNTLLPVKYVQNHDLWYGTTTDSGKRVPTVAYKTSYKSALDSNLLHYSDKKSLMERKKSFDMQSRELYTSAIEELGLDDIANELSKMDSKDFWKFVSSGKGIIDFAEVIYFVDTETKELIEDNIDEEIAKDKRGEIERVYQAYKNRRK